MGGLESTGDRGFQDASGHPLTKKLSRRCSTGPQQDELVAVRRSGGRGNGGLVEAVDGPVLRILRSKANPFGLRVQTVGLIDVIAAPDGFNNGRHCLTSACQENRSREL